MTTRIYIEESHEGVVATVYTISICIVGEPPVQFSSIRDPLTDGSRKLVEMRQTGRVELWDRQRAFPRASGDIEKLAALRVTESMTDGFKFEKYRNNWSEEGG